MKRLILLIDLFLLFVGYANQAKSQEQSLDPIIKNLKNAGFENLGAAQNNNDVYIFYENRTYRWEVDGLNRIFKEAANSLSDSINLHIVPLHRRVPITRITVKLEDYRKFKGPNNSSGNLFNVSSNVDSVKILLRKVRLQNRSLRKIDLFILPGVKFQFGNYDNPVEWQLSISPTIQTSLWKGMLLSAQVVIPLHSELQQSDENKIRPGTIAVNQLFRLPKSIFINTSAGIFSYQNKISSENIYQRYGVYSDIRKYFLNAKFCSGGYVSFTGQIRYSKGVLDYWPLDKFTYGIYSEYREPKYDLITRITAGKYLYNDYAIRLDLSRQFKEVNIGFFVLKSDLGYNGGFNFIVPLSPRKQFKPSFFRINLERYFNYEYEATTVHPVAATLETNSDLDETMHHYNSGYLKKQLENLQQRHRDSQN